jgi:hypothetical protein
MQVMRQAPVGQAVAAGSQPSGWDWVRKNALSSLHLFRPLFYLSRACLGKSSSFEGEIQTCMAAVLGLICAGRNASDHRRGPCESSQVLLLLLS